MCIIINYYFLFPVHIFFRLKFWVAHIYVLGLNLFVFHHSTIFFIFFYIYIFYFFGPFCTYTTHRRYQMLSKLSMKIFYAGQWEIPFYCWCILLYRCHFHLFMSFQQLSPLPRPFLYKCLKLIAFSIDFFFLILSLLNGAFHLLLNNFSFLQDHKKWLLWKGG